MHIRMTHEDPPAISVIDVVQVITGMAKNNAGNYFERMKTTHPEVSTNCRKNVSFPPHLPPPLPPYPLLAHPTRGIR